jgi:hypothetical protein
MLYPSNAQNAGELVIRLYKFSFKSALLLCLIVVVSNAENLIKFAPTQTVQLNVT